MGAKKSDDGTSFVWAFLLFLLFMAVAWPYFLGTWLAVEYGAGNPSTARSVIGWVLEVLWLGLWAWFAGWSWLEKKRKQDEARRLELLAQQRKRRKQDDARRLELLAQQRKLQFGSAGARLYEQADSSVSQIAASEGSEIPLISTSAPTWRRSLRISAEPRRSAPPRRTPRRSATSARPTSRCCMTRRSRSPSWRTR